MVKRKGSKKVFKAEAFPKGFHTLGGHTPLREGVCGGTLQLGFETSIGLKLFLKPFYLVPLET